MAGGSTTGPRPATAMPELIDISVRLEDGMPTWPGSVGYRRHHEMRLENGDPSNVSRLDFDVHCGTHIEAPLHFLPGGAPLEEIPLDTFVGAAWVADVGNVSDVSDAVLDAAGVPAGTARLLVKTGNSALWATPQPFRRDYAGLTRAAAEWVVARGIRLVGLDYLSIQRFADDFETHRILMRAGVLILEGLDLSGATTGPYELWCPPIRVAGAEAAPVRAILHRTEPR